MVRLEFAGEDNSYGGNYRLGDTALSLGVDIPLLGERYVPPRAAVVKLGELEFALSRRPGG
mgnify:CR=1 FL=1